VRRQKKSREKKKKKKGQRLKTAIQVCQGKGGNVLEKKKKTAPQKGGKNERDGAPEKPHREKKKNVERKSTADTVRIRSDCALTVGEGKKKRHHIVRGKKKRGDSAINKEEEAGRGENENTSQALAAANRRKRGPEIFGEKKKGGRCQKRGKKRAC